MGLNRSSVRVAIVVVAFLAGAGAMALVALAAGLWNRSSNPVILNTDRVEQAIQTSILQQRHLQSSVSCPVNIEQRRGVVFYCEATVGSRNYPVVVTEVDSKGHVTFAVV